MMILPQQPIVTIASIAAGAITVILSGASISNMYETYALTQRHHRQLKLQITSSPEIDIDTTCWKVDEAVKRLTSMKRKELKQLFLYCEPPELSDVAYSDDGDWVYDGYLLDNGPILTSVTGFITNRLFGKGKPWLGKAYMKELSSSSSNTVSGIGRNRFALSNNLMQTPTTAKTTKEESLDRPFEFYIGSSTLPTASYSSSAANKSLFNNYASQCSSTFPMSLIWGGMVDELRVVKCSDDKAKSGGKAVLLGMGYFAWSGGVWNIAPFCLVARRCSKMK